MQGKTPMGSLYADLCAYNPSLKPYLDTQVAIGPNFRSSEITKYITAAKALELYSTPTNAARAAQRAGKGSEVYERLKAKQPIVCWNVSKFTGNHRSGADAEELSGMMFFEVDADTDIDKLSQIPEFLFCWFSLSLTGYHFSVAVNGLNKGNFKSTWEALAERYLAMGIIVDPQAKDLPRASVIGYSDVFPNPGPVEAAHAVEPEVKVIQRKPAALPSDLSKPLANAYGVMLDKYGAISDGNRTRPAQLYFSICNHKGVPFEEALEYLFSQDGEHERFEEIGRDTYKRYAAEHATNALFSPENLDTSSSSFPIKNNTESVYVLPTGKKLSDLTIPLDKSMYVAAPPSAGKTFWLLKSGLPVDFLAPTQDQAKQIGHEYGIDYIMEGRPVTDSPVIVGTYNAIKKLTAEGRDTSERYLVFDEAHLAALAASYRGEVINMILDKASQYKGIICLSGTPVPSCHPVLSALPVVRVEPEKQVKKPYKAVIYTDRNAALRQRLKHGKRHIVVLQDRGEGEVLKGILAQDGYNAQCFNSETKDQENHRAIIENCLINEDVEVLIVTGLFFEGLNIYNMDIDSIHILSPVNQYHTEQLYNRPRLKHPEMLYFYFSEKSDLKQEVVFNYQATQTRYLRKAQAWVNAYNVVYEDSTADLGAAAENAVKGLTGDLQMIVRKKDGRLSINYIGIDYLTVKAQQQASYKNFDLFKNGLEAYGFDFAGFEKDTTEKDQAAAAAAAGIREDRKALARQEREEILSTFEAGGPGYVYDREQKSQNRLEQELAWQVMYAERIIPFDQAIQKVREYTDWDDLKGKLGLYHYNQTGQKIRGFTNKDVKLLQAIYGAFPIGETITSEEILKRFCTLKNSHPVTKLASYTQAITTRYLKRFFEVERVSIWKDGKPVKGYKILSNNPLNIQVPIQMAA